MHQFLVGGLSLVIGSALASSFPSPAAPVRARTLRVDGGEIEDVAMDAACVRAFKGIPYAAPPVGDLRWKPPAPIEAWKGARKSGQWGPRCMQGGRLGDIDPFNKRMDEDCLYLNVWTPAKSASEKLPVMVWIHGGSNNVGAGSEPVYGGANLARKGVVVVTINYRLDVFGFLAHPELTRESPAKASGNYGLLDQIAALEWVQRNIATFGGDPTQVTAFGESAGAFDISLLMASPRAKGLFARVIGQSGGAMTPIPGFGPLLLAANEAYGVKFAAALGASSIADLRAKPAQEILNAALETPAFFGLGVVDGHVAPDYPAKIFAAGKQNDVPLLVGWNADEGTLFARRGFQWGDGQPTYDERVRTQFKDRADKVLALYPPGETQEDAETSFAALLGDQIIGYGGWAWAERAAATGAAPTYRYFFTRRPPGAPEFSVNPLTGRGVYHSAELFYALDNLQVRDFPWEADDRRLAETMSSYWVNFAKTGNPNGDGLPLWPAYEPGGAGRVMELGKQIAVRGEPRRDRYEFLDGYYKERASEGYGAE